jgi:hypothetical protein
MPEILIDATVKNVDPMAIIAGDFLWEEIKKRDRSGTK